jgi:hypothetical protein
MIHANVSMGIYTNYNIPLEPNHVIVARYQCVDPDPMAVAMYRDGIATNYYEGVLVGGEFVPNQQRV